MNKLKQIYYNKNNKTKNTNRQEENINDNKTKTKKRAKKNTTQIKKVKNLLSRKTSPEKVLNKHKKRQQKRKERFEQHQQFFNKLNILCDELEQAVNEFKTTNKGYLDSKKSLEKIEQIDNDKLKKDVDILKNNLNIEDLIKVRIEDKYNVLLQEMGYNLEIGFMGYIPNKELSVNEIEESIQKFRKQNEIITKAMPILYEKENKTIKACEILIKNLKNENNTKQNANPDTVKLNKNLAKTLEKILDSNDINESLKHWNKFVDENKTTLDLLNENSEIDIKNIKLTKKDLKGIEKLTIDIVPEFLRPKNKGTFVIAPSSFTMKEKVQDWVFAGSGMGFASLSISIIFLIISVPILLPILAVSAPLALSTHKSYKKDFNYLQTSLNEIQDKANEINEEINDNT